MMYKFRPKKLKLVQLKISINEKQKIYLKNLQNIILMYNISDKLDKINLLHNIINETEHN